ncbi:MAG: hypothetical protein NTU79_00005, partial [Planctomycetota bacterium]|nr:hypothetical protein [Planctomycetota bacterium]
GIASSRLEKRRFASAKLNQRLWWTRPDCAHAIIGELLNQLIRTDVLNRRKFFQIENSAFERLEAGKWTEKSRDGREFRFRELGENKDFVELFDDSRQLKLRLYKNVGKIYNEQERQWRAWRGSEGSWK